MAIAPTLMKRLPGTALKRLVFSLTRRRRFRYRTTIRGGLRITGNTSDWIQRNLYYFGVWEPRLTQWLEGRLAPGDLFVDVGANIGYFALLAAQITGDSGRVIAVEPSPDVFEHLAAHVSVNRLGNTRLIREAAVGPDSPREVTLYCGDPANIGSSSLLAGNGGQHTSRVRARPLSEMLAADERRRARIIKIDVEGAETETVRGLDLERGGYGDQLELIVEISAETEKQRQDAGWLIGYLGGFGFKPYLVVEDHHFSSYMHPQSAFGPPVRLRTALTAVHNVIFSKIDAESL